MGCLVGSWVTIRTAPVGTGASGVRQRRHREADTRETLSFYNVSSTCRMRLVCWFSDRISRGVCIFAYQVRIGACAVSRTVGRYPLRDVTGVRQLRQVRFDGRSLRHIDIVSPSEPVVSRPRHTLTALLIRWHYVSREQCRCVVSRLKRRVRDLLSRRQPSGASPCWLEMMTLGDGSLVESNMRMGIDSTDGCDGPTYRVRRVDGSVAQFTTLSSILTHLRDCHDHNDGGR